MRELLQLNSSYPDQIFLFMLLYSVVLYSCETMPELWKGPNKKSARMIKFRNASEASYPTQPRQPTIMI